MADKIDQIKIGSTAYDIDLPPDASPSITSLRLTDQDNYTMDLHGHGFSVSDAANTKVAELDLSENRFDLGINVTNSGGVTTNQNLHLSTSGLTFTNLESDTSIDIGVQTNGNTSLTLIDRDGYEGLLTGGSFYFGDHTSRFLEFDISETRLEFGTSDGTLTSLHPGSINISNKDGETLSIGIFGSAPNPDKLGLKFGSIHLELPSKAGTLALTNEVLCKDANNNYIATECSIMDDETNNTAVFGKNSVVSGVAAFASGYLCEAKASGSTAFGYKSRAEGVGSFAEGAALESGGAAELANFTVSDFPLQTWDGTLNFSTSGSWAYGVASHVEGVQTVAIGYGAHAEGKHTIAYGNHSHTEGTSNIAEGEASHTEGYGTRAAGMWSHAEGEETRALHNGAHAEGCGSIASGPGSHAEGCGYYGRTTEVTAKIVKLDSSSNMNDWIFYNHVFLEDGEEPLYFTNLEHCILVPGTEIWNSSNKKVGTVYNAFNSNGITQLNGQAGVVFTAADFSASTNFSTASTYTFKIPAKGAQGEASHVGGYESIALGDFSRSGGYHNLTTGQSSTAFGSDNTIIGDNAMAIGSYNAVGGWNSFALGSNNILEAVGEASVVAGWYNKLSNGGTIITGSYNDVSAGNSIVVGNHNLINGSDSGAIGIGLKLMDGYGQLVCGKYNVVNPDAMFIVADGDDDTTRRNIFQVTVDGDAIVENIVYCKDVQCETINGGKPCTYAWDSSSGTLTIL